MKIMLVYLCDYEDRHDYYMSLLPVGLISLSSFLESKGHEIILCNYSQVGWKKASIDIIEKKPDIAGLSVFTHNKNDSNKLIASFGKSKKFHLTAGGAHVSFLAEEYIRRFPQLDSVIKGEGENSFLKLIEDVKNGVQERLVYSAERITSDGFIDVPSRINGLMKGVNPNEQFKYIITSRGCPNTCTYCSSPSYWLRKVTFRKIDDIISEIKYLQNKFGIIYFGIRDDNFTLKKQRVMEFSEKLIKNRIYIMWNCQSRVDTIDFEMLAAMKLSGLEHIQYGVESGSEKILSLYDKKIKPDSVINAAHNARKAGVYLSIYLMCGIFGETRADIQKTKEILRKILPGDVLVSPVAYYPGTYLYEQAVKDGILSDDDWFKKSKGIYLRNDEEINSSINEILETAYLLKEKAWYKDKDFENHRKNIVKNSWVTEILHGDYKLECDNYNLAKKYYSNAAKISPLNPWPYLRLGKVNFYEGDFESSLMNYVQVTDLVPNYYGGWLKSAESALASGKTSLASEFAEKAKSLNPYDSRIGGVISALKKNLRNQH